jgi:hypothetical protein
MPLRALTLVLFVSGCVDLKLCPDPTQDAWPQAATQALHQLVGERPILAPHTFSTSSLFLYPLLDQLVPLDASVSLLVLTDIHDLLYFQDNLCDTVAQDAPTAVDAQTARWTDGSLTLTIGLDAPYAWSLVDGGTPIANGAVFMTSTTGTFHVDLDALAARHSGLMVSGTLDLTETYQSVHVVTDGTVTIDAPDTTAQYTVGGQVYPLSYQNEVLGDTVTSPFGTQVSFVVDADTVPATSAQERNSVVVQMGPTGGRADATISEGDVAAGAMVTATECWAPFLAPLFYEDSAGARPTSGTASDCPTF